MYPFAKLVFFLIIHIKFYRIVIKSGTGYDNK